MIVTTAGRTDERMIHEAKKIANDLNIRYVHRKKQSIASIQALWNEDCIVVGKERLELYPLGESKPFFFHPNSSMFRIKRLMKGQHDPFIASSGLSKGMSLLDCTLGLASDSIVGSFIVGQEGNVVGVEGNPYLAYLVKKGLASWDSNIEAMDHAMKRIEVVTMRSIEYLSTLADNSFDCIYFDPMFEEHILESDGIEALTRFALYEDLTEALFMEAKRVTCKRVVLKDHFRSKRFERFGFQVHIRESAKFHYGVWIK